MTALDLDVLMSVFRAEAADNLRIIEDALLTLETRGVAEPELVRAVMRAAHTLKGNSAMVGLDAATRAAHALEDAMQAIEKGERALTPALAAGLLDAFDDLRKRVEGMESMPAFDDPTPATFEPVPVDPALADAESMMTAVEPAGIAPLPTITGEMAVPAAADATLRVNVRRLDDLLTLTGEIAIARGRLAALLGSQVNDTLTATLWHLEQLHGALQEEVMGLRLVPLGPVLRQQQRAMRDAARQKGRRARLELFGEDVEVDTRVAEQIKDPLIHMIRNAVDHGLEPEAERIAAGKDPVGTITLRAAHEAGAVVVTLRDDGRGLDRARIAAKAQALGLLPDGDAASDDDVFACIFAPGFSTAAQVTEVSGRGVGMDVVRKQVDALRGTIAIDSAPGRGTTFTIRLPLTVAIIAGFTVVAGGERYVLPLDCIEECLAMSGEPRETGVLKLRESALPWADLASLLGRGRATASRPCVVVVTVGEVRAGLVVDRLEGHCEAVVKPLTGVLRRLPGVAGSTILGSGRVALILDVPQIIARAARGRVPA